MADNSIQADQKFLMKGTFFTFLGIILKVLAPIFTIVIARVFGKEIFGIYVSTQLLVLTLCRVSVFGFDYGLHRYLPQNKVCNRPEHDGIIGSLRITASVAVLITVIICVGSYFGLHRLSSGLEMLSPVEISLYALSILPYSLLVLFGGASEGNRRPQYKIFINEFALSALAPIIALGLHFLHFEDRLSLPLGLFVANLLGLMVYIFLMNHQFPKLKWFVKDKIPQELLRFSLPIGFSEIVGAFLLRVDLWMVLALIGPEAAGVYAVMVTISNGLKVIRRSYQPILTPVVAGMSKERLDTDLKPVYSYCVSMVTLIQLGIGFFIVLFPEQVMMIAGKSFVSEESPVAVLGILMIGNLINGLFGLSGSVINGLGKSSFLFFLNVVSLVVAVVLNYICIPRMGIAGAALSSMLYQVMQCVWMNIYLKRMGYWPYEKYLIVQGIWIAALTAIYLLVNTVYFPTLVEKAIIFAVALLLILLTFWKQGLSKKGVGKKK